MKDAIDQKESDAISSISITHPSLCGYLWKFPSEGSNADQTPQETDDAVDDSYPRPCAYCRTSWVSSAQDERAHWNDCAMGTKHTTTPSKRSLDPKQLGTARRIWCEIDPHQFVLQWRVDATAPTVVDAIPLHLIDHVTLLQVPSHAFQMDVGDSNHPTRRRIVFQYRNDDQELQNLNPNDQIALWYECLMVESQRARQTRLEQLERAIQDVLRAIVSHDTTTVHQLLTETHNDLASYLDEQGSSWLLIAFKLGAGPEMIQTLLAAEVDCNAVNHDGESPLLLVAASGEFELLDLLLQYEPDDQTRRLNVNQLCASGATAFHAAANAGEVEILEKLLAAGAEIQLIDHNGWSALHYAAACPTGVDALHFLCELLPEMLDQPCTTDGNTPLHIAASYGCVDNVQALLQTAANPHLVNHDGKTAYAMALKDAHIQCAVVINEYMTTPADAYEPPQQCMDAILPPPAPQIAPTYTNNKVDHISAPEPVSSTLETNGSVPYPWTQYMTEDGLPYYYNPITHECTWHAPVSMEIMKQLERQVYRRIPPQETSGQKLPLCLIPMVSPLISMDDPTAATKYERQRKKDREKRRRRNQRLKTKDQESYSTSHSSSHSNSIDYGVNAIP